MAQHQTPSRQVESAINEDARRGVDAPVRVDGYHDVAKTRETLCEVSVSSMTRHGNVTGGTGARESVLNIDIKMFGRSGQATTGGVISM
jgi:hypothetical protein